ncbi:hypothetical protein FRB99_002215 [Tulasnella sp. 403]|nr:hypothetical protein FRB99_002215 [Tulasnella sp. 403]
MGPLPRVNHISGKIRIIQDGQPAAYGGFANVFKGAHSKHGEVALKHVSVALFQEQDQDPDAKELQTLQLILAEVDVWRSLEHPHVLQFLGLYTSKKRLYMVSPWAEGGCLIGHLRQHPDTDRVRFIREIADALSYLHERNIIHGDIKGSNVLLSRSNGVLLCDFGMSRWVGDKTKSLLKGGGSERWIAPEIWKGGSKSFQSDVFAFGMTIYQVLSGKPPFYDYGSPSAVPYAFSNGERPPSNPESSPIGHSYGAIWDIAERCWQGEPSARPSMLKVFRDICDLPVLPVPPTVRAISNSTPDLASSGAGPIYLNGAGDQGGTARSFGVLQGLKKFPKFMASSVVLVSSNRGMCLPFYDAAPSSDPDQHHHPWVIPTDTVRLTLANGERLNIRVIPGPPIVSGNFSDLLKSKTTYKGRPLALKRCRFAITNVSKEDRDLFRREAAIWQQLNHPHILEFYGIGTDRLDTLFLVSPWMENRSLWDFIEKHESCDRPRFLRESAEGLRYLHSQHFIHGDIKAQNILVSDDHHALLCDFGLSKITNTATIPGIKGLSTLKFQSPELWRGATRTEASDAYAFGMTIYQVLSRLHPFESIYTQGVLINIVCQGGRPPKEPISSANGVSYASLWDVAERCWAEDPSERPSMVEVVEALTA